MNGMFSSLHTFFFAGFHSPILLFWLKMFPLGIRPEAATMLLSTMFLARFIMLLVKGLGS